MLVLTRRVGEEIVIGGDIRVTVLTVQGAKIRLGITAPAGIRVDRQEVHQRRAQFSAGPNQSRGKAVIGRIAKSLRHASHSHCDQVPVASAPSRPMR